MKEEFKNKLPRGNDFDYETLLKEEGGRINNVKFDFCPPAEDFQRELKMKILEKRRLKSRNPMGRIFEFLNFRVSWKYAAPVLALTSFLLLGLNIALLPYFPPDGQNIVSFVKNRIFEIPSKEPEIAALNTPVNLKQFVSEEEFKSYLRKSPQQSVGFGQPAAGFEAVALESPIIKKGEPEAAPERFSETTVQVAGIDEPDIVKTDGKNIYFSLSYYGLSELPPVPLNEDLQFKALPSSIMPYRINSGVKIIKAFPAAELTAQSNIEKSGDLLLENNILIIFDGQEILGYDVADPKAPKNKWALRLESNTAIAGARLYGGKVHLITQTGINEDRPCPIQPLAIKGKPLNVECREIYHPIKPIPVDVAFSAMTLDPDSGQIEKKLAFVGSQFSSIVYMSENAIYITYPYDEEVIRFLAAFLKEGAKDIVSAEVIGKVEKLTNSDIDQLAKIVELKIIWGEYLNSLGGDERIKTENEFFNRLSDYQKKHLRELEKTGIVKIELADFKVLASGSVPGRLLNQFSLDEHNGYLRLAVTVSQNWAGGFMAGFFAQQTASPSILERVEEKIGNLIEPLLPQRTIMPVLPPSETANDVYVLNEKLEVQGAVKDLGLGERIYSARFIRDAGYLVTFRQTDPFYVLDLSDPQKPALKGELKIPGYSSYLQSIANDKILGIGKENRQVKVSLFDVASPENPKEIAKYILDESWSDVLSTHRAFLLDKKHNIFFLPGSRGGYIFSYQNNNLELVKAVEQPSVKRAVYINDFLYIISDEKITVFNETDWSKVNERKLQ